MRSTIESEIRARVEAFADELVSLIQTSALEAVQGALGDDGGRRRGRTGSARDSASRGGGKRDPDVIAALTDELFAFIAENPGKRIEEISSALETPTRDLVLPVRRLIAAKRVSTRGQKRATTYFAGTQRATAGSRKKSGRAPARDTKKRGKRAAPKSRGRVAKRRRGAGTADGGAEKSETPSATAQSE